jgi:aspartyl-tRNA synthetase
MTYADAMAQYGSDKPDVRFDLKLAELPELLLSNGGSATAAAVLLRCDTKWAPGDTKRLLELLGEHGPSGGALEAQNDAEGPALGVIKVQGESKYKGDRLPGGHDAMCEVLQRLGARADDTVFVAHSPRAPSDIVGCPPPSRAYEPVQLLLGRVRLALADWLEEKGELSRSAAPNMLWVHDFPLYEQE